MKLRKLLHLFTREHLHYSDEEIANMEEDFVVLRQHLNMIFPSEMVVNDLVDKIKRGQVKRDEATADALPFHTRDAQWMQAHIKNVMDQADKPVEPNNIQVFMDWSPEFDVARFQFEQSLVKSEIIATLRQDHVSGMAAYANNYDEVFRIVILDKMGQTYGLDRQTAEIALEANSKIWREPTMVQAFNNQFYRNKDMANYGSRPMHQALWMRVREYDYYQDHKAVVDKVGAATPAMKLPHKKAHQLRMQLAHYNRINKEMKRYYEHHEFMDHLGVQR